MYQYHGGRKLQSRPVQCMLVINTGTVLFCYRLLFVVIASYCSSHQTVWVLLFLPRCHHHADSLFSTSSGFSDYHGVLNWLIVLSVSIMWSVCLCPSVRPSVHLSVGVDGFRITSPWITFPNNNPLVRNSSCQYPIWI